VKMTEKAEQPGSDVSKRFRDLTADVREERLVRYVIRQLQLGRHLDDVLRDAYVVDHSMETTRMALLEHPEVIQALEKGLRSQFADFGEKIGGTSGEEPPDD